jgi:hypothetical protein
VLAIRHLLVTESLATAPPRGIGEFTANPDGFPAALEGYAAAVNRFLFLGREDRCRIERF